MRHLYITYLLFFPLSACVVDVPDFADENQTFRCESHSHCLESENYYCAGAENGQRGRCLKASPGNCTPGCGHPDNRCVFDPEAQESICSGVPSTMLGNEGEGEGEGEGENEEKCDPECADNEACVENPGGDGAYWCARIDGEECNEGHECVSGYCDSNQGICASQESGGDCRTEEYSCDEDNGEFCILLNEASDTYGCRPSCWAPQNGGFCAIDNAGKSAQGRCLPVEIDGEEWLPWVCVECTATCTTDYYCYPGNGENVDTTNYAEIQDALLCTAESEFDWTCDNGKGCAENEICVNWENIGGNELAHDMMCQYDLGDDCDPDCGSEEICVQQDGDGNWGCEQKCDAAQSCDQTEANANDICITVTQSHSGTQMVSAKICYACDNCDDGQTCTLEEGTTAQVSYLDEADNWSAQGKTSCEDSTTSCTINDDCTDATCIGGICQTLQSYDGSCDEEDDGDCESGFSCTLKDEAQGWVCKNNNGATCSNNNECARTCIAGECETISTALLPCDENDGDDCGDGLTCTNNNEENNFICRLDDNKACDPTQGNEQCVSNLCYAYSNGENNCAASCDALSNCSEPGHVCIEERCVEHSSVGEPCDGDDSDCVAGANLVCVEYAEPGPFGSEGGMVCLYNSEVDDVACESNFDCSGGYCDGTEQSTGTGTCADTPYWYAVDLSDQPGFIQDALGPMDLTLTGNAHPALIYSGENQFFIQHYNQHFAWNDTDKPGSYLFADLVIIDGNALAAVNKGLGENNVIKTLRYDGDGTPDEKVFAQNINATTRPVIAALAEENGTIHVFLSFVDSQGALVILTYNSAQAGDFEWHTVEMCEGHDPITGIATNTTRDIDIEAIGNKVAIVYRKDADELGFAFMDNINDETPCWKTDPPSPQLYPGQSLVHPQISFITSDAPGNEPYPIVTWHEHSQDESQPKHDIKMAIFRINAENPAWSDAVSFHSNHQNAIVTGASHDLPQIVGDNNHANKFYLAWRRCTTKRCDYTGGEAAENFSTRLVNVNWPEGENTPQAYNDIHNSNDEGLNDAPGVREIRLVADDERLCVATYHRPLIQGNESTSGNIYLVCHDAL